MFSLHQQYLDMASGFHVIELRDPTGNRHLIQLALGADCCPACGAAHPKDNLGSLDPAAAVKAALEALNTSRQQMLAYAARHGVAVR